MMTEDEVRQLAEVVQCALRALDKAGTKDAKRIVEPIRTALADRGLTPNCRVGQEDLSRSEIIEWFAGQILDIVDNETWWCVNSLLNCCEKFTGIEIDGTVYTGPIDRTHAVTWAV